MAEFSSQSSIDPPRTTCPPQKNQTEPCDINTLEVILRESDGKTQSVPAWKQPLRKIWSGNPQGIPVWLLRSLSEYDVIIEAIASRHTTEVSGDAKSDNKPVNLEIYVSLEGSCPDQKHPIISVVPKDISCSQDSITKEFEGIVTKKVYARPLSRSSWSPTNWVQSFWPFGDAHIKDLIITADSCGIRAKGDPNEKMNCLVRIHPDDHYQLTLKIPSFYGLKRERKASVEWKKAVSTDKNKAWITTSEQSSSSSRFGQTVSEDSSSHAYSQKQKHDIKSFTYAQKLGDTYYEIKSSEGTQGGDVFIAESETETHFKGRLFSDRSSTTNEDSTATGRALTKEKHRQLDSGILLTRNGAELDISKTINSILALKKTIEDGWNSIKGMVPKVGWSIDLSLAIMEGSITGEWGIKSGGLSGERWALVKPYVLLEVDVKVISLLFTLMAGFEFKIDSPTSWIGVGDAKILWIIAKIEASFEITAAIKGTISFSDKEKILQSEKSGFGWKVGAHGRVEVVGFAYDAQAGLKGGMKFDGAMKYSPQKAPTIEGNFYFEETIVYLYVSKPGKGRMETKWEKKLYEECTLWKGSLPG